MTQLVCGLLVCGLSYGGSTNATLFTDAPLDASTLPSLAPLSSSAQVVKHMVAAGIRGGSIRVEDLRNPVYSTNDPVALLQDDATGTLSALFTLDAGWANTTRWTLPDTVRLDPSTTSITLYGATAPTVNQLIWIGSECMKVTAVSSINYNHACTVSRAQCGSRAVTLEINPDAYPPGDNGVKECMIAYSRQPFDGDRRIECALYQFEMSPNDAQAVSATRWVWYGYLAQRPTCNADFVWSVTVSHYAKALAEAVIPGEGSMDLTYCVQFLSTRPTFDTTTHLFSLEPSAVAFRFTVYEFEKLFNAPVHYPQGDKAGSILTTLDSYAFQDSKVSYEIRATIGGYDWVFKVTDIDSTGVSAGKHVIKVQGVLLHKTKDARLSDNPVSYEQGDGYLFGRNEGLNEGWVKYVVVPVGSVTDIQDNRGALVRRRQGETPPNVTLRVKIKDSFANTAIRLLLSDKGGKKNDATYDTILGSRGMGLNPSWVNVGSAATGLTVDQGTQEWLGLAALDDDVYEYTFSPGDKVGEWFANELRLRCMILTFVPSTGKLGARYWARPWSGATALNPVHYPVIEVISDDSLPDIRAVFIERGFDPIMLAPSFRKPIQTPETRRRDIEGGESTTTIKIWKQAGGITDTELQSGPLAKLMQATLGVGLGKPRVFKIPLDLSSTVQLADQVTWTDNSIPTPTGRGFTTRKLFVLGLDRDMAGGILYAVCVEDIVNQEVDAVSTAGEVASGIVVTGIGYLDEATLSCLVTVESLSTAQKFAVATQDDTLWASIQTAGGVLHVTVPDDHNRSAALEPIGHKEAYATLTSYKVDNNAKRSWLTLTFAAAWLTDRGYTVADLVKLNQTRIGLPTPKSTNASAGSAVHPIAHQSHNGGAGSDRLHASPMSRRPRWDGRRSLLG